jgi:hypothetical protein
VNLGAPLRPLTRAELDVKTMLEDGRTLEEIAAARGLTAHSAYCRVTAVFRAHGVDRVRIRSRALSEERAAAQARRRLAAAQRAEAQLEAVELEWDRMQRRTLWAAFRLLEALARDDSS